MVEQPFESETDLELILSEHPELITDGLVGDGAPPRWLLISRQVGVDFGSWSNRWAVDLLFVDEHAVPALVEVKRSSNPGLRRGVVAQVLDYAASAVLSWSAERLRTTFAETWEARGRDPGAVLDEFLRDAGGTDGFWQRANANLQAGKIRLVFAADEVPAELQRVLGFLSRQMRTASVLAVEVKRFGAPVADRGPRRRSPAAARTGARSGRLP